MTHDKHNKSLGRASYDKKETKKTGLKKDRYMMPPITQFSSGKITFLTLQLIQKYLCAFIIMIVNQQTYLFENITEINKFEYLPF